MLLILLIEFIHQKAFKVSHAIDVFKRAKANIDLPIHHSASAISFWKDSTNATGGYITPGTSNFQNFAVVAVIKF